MIIKFTENFKRNGLNVKGQILLTEFSKIKCPFKETIGRGCSKYMVNDRFMIQSLNHPKIKIFGMSDDYIISLCLWGTDKSKDNIVINKDFPNVEIAKNFMKIIKKMRLKYAN